MTTYGTPSAKTRIVDKFRDQLERLREYVRKADETAAGQLIYWYVPDGLEGKSVLDITGISDAFDREELYNLWDEVVADPQSPGTTADLGMCALQGDALASLERAYRARHHTACRSRTQPVARLRGHHHAAGVIKKELLELLVWLDRQNKGEPAV
jgi:hypothetical protein